MTEGRTTKKRSGINSRRVEKARRGLTEGVQNPVRSSREESETLGSIQEEVTSTNEIRASSLQREKETVRDGLRAEDTKRNEPRRRLFESKHRVESLVS